MGAVQSDLFKDGCTAVPSIEQQTGWKRPFKSMICQDHKILKKISQFDFNLKADGFLAYHASRTGIHVLNADKPELVMFLLTSPDAETWLLESTDFRRLDGRVVPFGWERESAVRSNQIQKARLQDSWELFNKRRQL